MELSLSVPVARGKKRLKLAFGFRLIKINLNPIIIPKCALWDR